MKRIILCMIAYIFCITSCNIYTNEGYLARHPSPLEETRSLKNNKTPLQIIAKQSLKIETIEQNNDALNAQLALCEASQDVDKIQIKKLQEDLNKISTDCKNLKKQLQEYKKLSKEQQKQMIELTIQNVRTEQELIQAKIKLLKQK